MRLKEHFIVELLVEAVPSVIVGVDMLKTIAMSKGGLSVPLSRPFSVPLSRSRPFVAQAAVPLSRLFVAQALFPFPFYRRSSLPSAHSSLRRSNFRSALLPPSSSF